MLNGGPTCTLTHLIFTLVQEGGQELQIPFNRGENRPREEKEIPHDHIVSKWRARITGLHFHISLHLRMSL